MKLADVIEELVEERGLDKNTLNAIVSEGMLAAYERKFPEFELKIEKNAATGDFAILVKKYVVAVVDDELNEISLKKARFINKNCELDSTLWMPFEGKIGRIEILRARQIISNKIKHIEALAVFNEFKEKQGKIVIGVIHKTERTGVSVKMGEVLAFLPKVFSIPNEKLTVGFSIKALLKTVLEEPHNDYQLILDRSSTAFLQKLFELEIPEVFEKLVEIKKIVRIPGYKSKVAVHSHDRNIDPVGTCVGVGGSRIKPVLKELNGEKIDIFPWTESLELFVKNALKPAHVNSVKIDELGKEACVYLDDDQRSIAIGKNGQNIALAAQITGITIQLARLDGTKNDAISNEQE